MLYFIYDISYCQNISIQDKEEYLKIDDCYFLAEKNYPLIKNLQLMNKSVEYNISNAAKNYLPQISLSAQASYQSDVTEFPNEMNSLYEKLGINMHALNKDQYRVLLELYQNIWDGGIIKSTKYQSFTEGEVEKASLNIELYSIRKKINDLYFGILLLDSRLKQNLVQQNVLYVNLNKVNSLINNGVAMLPDANILNAELLTLKQQYIVLESTHKAYKAMLKIFIGRDVDKLCLPSYENINVSQINRPELDYMPKLEQNYVASERLVKSQLYPKIGVQIQGIYGYPGLNLFKDMTDNSLKLNYIASINLKWNIGAFYTKKNKLNNIKLAKAMVENKRETFLFNTKLSTLAIDSELDRLKKCMEYDDNIIKLRESVRQSYESKLQNGIINIADLVRELSLETNARITKSIHHIEIIKNIYDLKFTTNNY